MPKTVQIPGLGRVQFPDSMSDKEIGTEAQKAWESHQASREALQAPPVDPIDVAQFALAPQAMLSSPLRTLAGTLKQRLAGAASTGTMEGFQSWLAKNYPNHPWLNTLGGLAAGVATGHAISGIKKLPKTSGIEFAPEEPPPLSLTDQKSPIKVPPGGFHPPFQASPPEWPLPETPTSPLALTDQRATIKVPPGGFEPPYVPQTPGTSATENRSLEVASKLQDMSNKIVWMKGKKKAEALQKLRDYMDEKGISYPKTSFKNATQEEKDKIVRDLAYRMKVKSLEKVPPYSLLPRPPITPEDFIPESESRQPQEFSWEDHGNYQTAEVNRVVASREPGKLLSIEPMSLSGEDRTRLRELGWKEDSYGQFVKKDTEENVYELRNFMDNKDPFEGNDLSSIPSSDKGIMKRESKYSSLTGIEKNPNAKYLKGSVHSDNSGLLQSSIFPGAKEFFDQDVGPALDHFKGSWDHVKRVFAPATRGELASRTAQLLRMHMGKSAMESERAYAPVESVRKFFSRRPTEDSLRFMHAIESGKAIVDPRLNEAAKSIRDTLDSLWNKMNSMGILNSYIENYFPHLWKNERYATDSLARYTGKRPWEGTETFTKKRFYGTIQEGMAAGKTLSSNNPVELFMASVSDMNRLIHAREAWGTLQKEGLTQFVKVGEKPPLGMEKISDRIAKILRLVPGEGLVHVGDYYLPDEAAQVIDNHLSKGMMGNPIYDSVRMAANLLNSFQLGLSAFHITFVGGDAASSSMSLGLRELSQGRTSGLSKIAKGASILGADVRAYRKGSALLKAYLGKTSMTPDMQKMVESVVQAGGRVHIDPIYRLPDFEAVLSRLMNHNYLGAAIVTPVATIHALSKPIFEHYVPRMKLGVFFDMAKSEMERFPNASPEELRPLLQKAWDSVDNRMGMMVYDNLFLKKAEKDALMVSQRSVGWNAGTVRELGGGVIDIKSSIKNREMSHRLAYLITVPVMTLWMGSLLYYARFGTSPPSLLDAFYTPTGEKRPDGSLIRTSIPTYWKDIVSYSHAPVGTLVNKLNPLWSSLYEMFNNKDFYGDQIANPQDDALSQAEQYGKYIGKSLLPFSVKNFEQRSGSPESALESFFGFTVAPHAIGETPAQTLLHQILSVRAPVGGRTEEQSAKSDEKRKILSDIRNSKDWKAEMKSALSSGQLSPKDAMEVLKSSRLSPIQNGVRHLGLHDTLLLFRKANPEERKQILPLLIGKMKALTTMSASERDQVIPMIHELFPQTAKRQGAFQ